MTEGAIEEAGESGRIGSGATESMRTGVLNIDSVSVEKSGSSGYEAPLSLSLSEEELGGEGLASGSDVVSGM